MTARRIISKQLFNFVPRGKMNDDIKESRPTLWTLFQLIVAIIVYLTCYFVSTFIWKLNFKLPGEAAIQAVLLIGRGIIFKNDEDYVKGFRILCNFGFQMLQKSGAYDEVIEECDHSELDVPTSHLGQYWVSVLVHTPKKLDNEVPKPAIVYAHGGGVIGCSASTHKRYLSKLAIRCNVVVLNVDYRRAPETRCPNNILDFYEALKYIIRNSDRMGIDKSRIAIAGESGGGYICFGTMVLIAQRNESHLIKLAMPIVPMTDDDSFRSTNLFSIINFNLRKIWKLIAQDIQQQKNDPLLFPGKASEEILKNMPPTILWETEFDMFIKESTRLANRLRSAGRLLEFVVFPGQTHESWINPKFECHESVFDSFALATQKYLIE